MADREEALELLEEEWSQIADLCSHLTEEEWKTPTDLPGWTVQDVIAHVAGAELGLLGEPAPEVEVGHLPHITSPFQEIMEVWVESWRGRTGQEVYDEYLEATSRRVAAMNAMTEEDWAKPGWSPIGEVPYRDFMRVRTFDAWMHEQDVRRALDRPGHLSGRAVDCAMERFSGALGVIVGKRAGAPDGSSVVIRTTGGADRVFPVLVEGRARVAAPDEAPADPTVEITLPFTTFVALGGGRWDLDRALAEGGVSFRGDEELGRGVLSSMSFTP